MNRFLRVTALAALALSSVIAGCDDSHTGDAGVDGDIMRTPVAVETVASESVQAGQEILVSCLLVDATGEVYTPPADLRSSLRIVPEESVAIEEGRVTAVRAGSVEIACIFTSLRMTDETPAIVDILPGQPAHVVTHLDRDSITAGETVTATCETFDAYGNRVPDSGAELRASPERENNTFEGLVGTFEGAGHFDVHCELFGAESPGAELEVVPALPASLLISRVPDQPVYAVGQVVDIARLVTDRFGNEIPDAIVPVESVMIAPSPPPVPAPPPPQQLGDGRFRFLADGVYRLTATVQPPTDPEAPPAELTKFVDVIVDSGGPAINCDDPIDGAILNIVPGTSLSFRGSVNDLSGVGSVTINGASVRVASNGTFSTTLTTQYGINFVDIAAVDGANRESSRTCAFLVSTYWAPDNTTSGDMLSLRLRQGAFDDGSRTAPINSIADVLHTVLNSTGLRDTLHSQLLAANPLKPSACDETVWGVCVLRSEVIYLDSRIDGPNTVSLTLVDGGMRVQLRASNVRVRVRVRGHVAGINYDTTGWVTVDYVDVGATFDTWLSGSDPRVTLRGGSVTAAVGGVSTSFSGLDGAIIDIVVWVFEGTVRNLIRDAIRNWVTNNLDDVLQGVLSGLDINTLGTSFNVPKLDGTGTVRLNFNVGFSSLTASSSRMLFGIGTRFYSTPAHARPTLGAPLRSWYRLNDVGTVPLTTAGVALHEGAINQALHALWRGGFFDANITGSSLGGLPAGVEARIATYLPPVAILRSDRRVELSLGAVSMSLIYPALFAEPVQVNLGARASMSVALVGNDLVFGDFRIEELYFSTDLTDLPMTVRDSIEDFLRRLLQRVIGSALNDALPAVPIPSFELPYSLTTYGIPYPTRLGLTSLSYIAETPHFVLRGNFGAL